MQKKFRALFTCFLFCGLWMGAQSISYYFAIMTHLGKHRTALENKHLAMEKHALANILKEYRQRNSMSKFNTPSAGSGWDQCVLSIDPLVMEILSARLGITDNASGEQGRRHAITTGLEVSPDPRAAPQNGPLRASGVAWPQSAPPSAPKHRRS